ncbi:MAG TPA: Rv3235 family protein [Actinomycetota bacterium]|nr:Rv3235 family protein [Actinomycetota bacterium]
MAVTREIALALLEVEAGCRSVSQLERVVSRELWEELEPCIGRRGGPLPSGRSVISICCQEDLPGLADTVAVVRKGDLVRPVALRLDAGGGRWIVTELRWWRNETDTATTPGRDDGSS